MLRYATIDVGSNSVLLLVAERTHTGFTVVEEHMELTRLGEGMEQTGRLTDVAMERTFQAVDRLARP